MLIYSDPSIADRTDYILGRSEENPLDSMIKIGKALGDMGAVNIAIPCITAHYFHDALTTGIQVPIIHIIKETAQYLAQKGIRCAGIMATEGTIYSRLFQEELSDWNIATVVPTEDYQKQVTDLIYQNVKANLPVDLNKFEAVSEYLRKEGADIIILGCTELSLIKRDYCIGPGYLDAMEVLAMRSIQVSEARLKGEYEDLITS